MSNLPTDDVVVSGLTPKVQVSGAESSQDTGGVSALGGDDNLASAVGVTGPAAIALDGGPGNDAATYSGTSAADTIGIVNNGTAVRTFSPGDSPQDTTGIESLVVQGLGGDDTVTGGDGITGSEPANDSLQVRLSDKVVSVLVGVGRCPDRRERRRWVHRQLLGGGGCDPVLVEL